LIKKKDFIMHKKFETASLILQGLYSGLCIINIILCLIYRSHFDNTVGNTCAHLAFDLMGILVLCPAMPIGIILNICALRKRQTENIPHKNWLCWMILSPFLYILFCVIAGTVLVLTTGGI